MQHMFNGRSHGQNTKLSMNVRNARLLLLSLLIAVVLSTAAVTLFLCNVTRAHGAVQMSLKISKTGTKSGAPSRKAGPGAAAAHAASVNTQVDRSLAAAFQRPAAGSPLPTGKFVSQLGQDKYIDDFLHGMTDGFFVESGAHNGFDISNTLFFEANRNWTGLLVEANPALFDTLMSNCNRTQSIAINACLSPSGKQEKLEFALGGFIGGLTGFMSESHKQRMRNEVQAAGASQPDNTGKTVGVTCWPLHEMMAALGRKKIDYWR
jgi:hypothetical protein